MAYRCLYGTADGKHPVVPPKRSTKKLIDTILNEGPVLIPDFERNGFTLAYREGRDEQIPAVEVVLKCAAAQMDPDMALRNAIRGVWE